MMIGATGDGSRLMMILDISSVAITGTGGGALGAVSAGDSVIIDTSLDFSILITGVASARGSTGGLPPP